MDIFGTEQSNVVVVTRHAALIEYLRTLGFSGPIVEHATVDDVRGKVVVGVLPLHLAAEAAVVGSVVMDVPQDKRGHELTLEEVVKFMKRIDWFVVRTSSEQQRLLDESNLSGLQGGSSLWSYARMEVRK